MIALTELKSKGLSQITSNMTEFIFILGPFTIICIFLGDKILPSDSKAAIIMPLSKTKVADWSVKVA